MAAAAREGDVRADVAPAMVTRLLFGTVNSVVEWYRPDEHRPDQVADAVVALAFDGLRAGTREAT